MAGLVAKLHNRSKAKPGRQRETRPPGEVRARTAHAVVLAALGVGFIGGLRALVAPLSPPTPVIAAPTATEPSFDVGAGGFAELYVTTWLSLTRDNTKALMAFYPGVVDVPGSTSKLAAARTTVVDQKSAGDAYWAVTVAADVASVDDKGQSTPLGVRYYSTGVRRDRSSYVATSLPAEVPAPPAAKSPKLAVDGLNPPSRDDRAVTDALDGFLAALLTGTGNVERYITPGAQITAVRPPPFAEVRIRGLGIAPGAEPTKRVVRVEVAATAADKTTQTLHYSLAITQRDSRWEITELLPAAPLAPTTRRSPS
jgi:hypothetical protein